MMEICVMGLEVTGANTNRTIYTQIANDAIPITPRIDLSRVVASHTPQLKMLVYNRAENIRGFEAACGNFAHLSSRDIKATFLPQSNLDPERITESDVARTNKIWG
ncbi:hypothetical protein IJ579_00365 [bacterium]|nr:hypothetical protein [bacterium]